ncbi:MAG: squalene synthase HpnC [Proteobacteria bacterium]|nr:squalene synthase HpnC [Pseudomonadota bacterium]MDA1059461.1 squalene synthase HpnC [Pseudomonadota bacterium]
MDHIETPSGKGAGDENFPVGSWLLPKALRPHVTVFYRFARGADDIADNPELAPDDKLARLDRLAAALRGETRDDPAAAIAHRMRESLATTGVSARHCLDILDAFRQDATMRRYADWDALMGYCARSANPVGRYLLDLHGEDSAGYAASDALCSALQIINHLQDAQDDFRSLDRVYVPQNWLAHEGIDASALEAARSDARLRRVFDRCLDGVDDLLVRARPLPVVLRSGRLALEAAAIWSVAHHLAAALRRRDPIAGRVAPSRAAFTLHAGAGVLSAMLRRSLARRPHKRIATRNP